MTPRRSKPATRRTSIARRDAIQPEVRSLTSAAICRRAHEWLARRVPANGRIALYAATGSEVDTALLDQLARASGWTVAYPRVVAGTRILAFHDATIEQLSPGWLALREPLATSPAIPIAAIDVFAIPGLAFDRSGGRLGWGRGYYDATLAGSRARRLGLAFENQLVAEVEREPHDQPLDAIATELAIHEVTA